MTATIKKADKLAATNVNGTAMTNDLVSKALDLRSDPVFEPLDLAALLAMPPKKWLIDQIFGDEDLMMLYGPPGAGKTFVVIDLIFSACLATTFANRFTVTQPLTVAYTAGEGISGLPQRFRAAAEYYGVDSLPGFSFFNQVPQLHRRAGSAFDTAENIEKFVEDWGNRPLDLLVIDTFHSATVGAEENAAGDMGRAVYMAKAAQREIGCSVMFVHHTNKNGTAERGSSSLRGHMDTMIGLKQIGTKWSIYCEKLKDGATWQPQSFSLTAKADSVRVHWHDPVEPNEDAGGKQEQDKQKIINLLSETGEPLAEKEITDVIDLSRQHVNKLLVQLTEEGKIERGKRDSKKPKSNRNPWTYFLADNNEEGTANDTSGQDSDD